VWLARNAPLRGRLQFCFPCRIALVIGNNAYENVPQLQKAVNDADAIAAELSKATVGQQAKSDLVQPA
jgi:hypothetical protein